MLNNKWRHHPQIPFYFRFLPIWEPSSHPAYSCPVQPFSLRPCWVLSVTSDTVFHLQPRILLLETGASYWLPHRISCAPIGPSDPQLCGESLTKSENHPRVLSCQKWHRGRKKSCKVISTGYSPENGLSMTRKIFIAKNSWTGYILQINNINSRVG